MNSCSRTSSAREPGPAAPQPPDMEASHIRVGAGPWGHGDDEAAGVAVEARPLGRNGELHVGCIVRETPGEDIRLSRRGQDVESVHALGRRVAARRVWY